MPAEAPGPGAGLDAWLAWQETLHPAGIALGLERVGRVANRLGLTQDTPLTITVGGTNGKGSAVYLLDGILRAGGRRCGRYVSPHLRHYRERMAVDGRLVEDADLLKAFRAIEAARDGEALTYFEFGTLAALWWFRDAGVEIQVLEVGLGGRLDAVNVVDADAALVTQVGTDHEDWLGKGREVIGTEKAGIFRAGRPAICGDLSPPASLEAAASKIGADLWKCGRDFRHETTGDTWNWQGRRGRWRKLPLPAVTGRHALHNAAAVLAVVEALAQPCPVGESEVRTGLVQWQAPGRFERRGILVYDVAHNVEAATSLADNLSGISPVPVVLGMLSDKPVEGFARALGPRASIFHCAGLPPPRGLAGGDLADRVQGVGRPVRAHATVAAAIEAARADARDCGTIVVTGSFLTVGEAMALDAG